MKDNMAQVEIVVTNAEGQWATVVAVPDPRILPKHEVEPELVYGMCGLRVDRISENEFRDFQGQIWKVPESPASGNK